MSDLTIQPPDPAEPAEAWCNTAGCFAGWRAFRDGYTHRVWLGDDWGWSAGAVENANGRRVRVMPHAGDRFELTVNEQLELFSSENTMEDLKDKVDLLCEQPGRSETSKALLQETLQDVLAADAVGRWNQLTWAVGVGGHVA